jgi:hypothetical protein
MSQVFNSSNVKISEAGSSTPRFRNYGGTEDTGMFQKGTTDFGYPDLQEIGTGLKNPDMTKDYGYILSKEERTPSPKIVESVYHPRPDNWEALNSTGKKQYTDRLLDKHWIGVKDGILQRKYQYARPYEHPDPGIGKVIQLYNVEEVKNPPEWWNAQCSICGKKNCTGSDDRGFGRHGGKCKFCGKTDCTGDENKGFGIHYLNSRADWHEEPDSRRRDRNNKPKRIFRPGRPEPTPEEAPTRYTGLDEALVDILSQHPAIKNQNIDPRRLIGTNDIQVVLPNPKQKKSSKMIFNASESVDPDDYEYLQSSSDEPTESLGFDEAPDSETSEIEKENESASEVGADIVGKHVNFDALKAPGLEQVLPDTETNEAGEFNIGGGVDTGHNERHPEDFEPSYYDVATVPCPMCFGKSKKNNLDNYKYTSNHCKKCNGTCGSNEKNGANHCLGCKKPEKCAGREHESWTYKDPNGNDILDKNKKPITTCPMCDNDGEISEQYADALISAVKPEAPTQIESDTGSANKTKKFKAPKVLKLQHIPDERAEDFLDDDEVIGTPVVTSPSAPTAISAPSKKTFSLRELPGGKATKADSSIALPDVETPSFMDLRGLSEIKDTDGKRHNNCGCAKRGGKKINGDYRPGLATDQEIAKIKQSDDYKKGIASINSSTEPGTRTRDQKLDEFIESQYRCKGDE